MARIIISLSVLPKNVNVDLEGLKPKIEKIISKSGGEVGRVEIEPVAFGLESLKIIFITNEVAGGTEELENSISKIEGVQSVRVTDVRRAIG